MDKTIIEGIAVVYKITNTVNGKIYVGSSARYLKRKKRHFEDLKYGNHHCLPLQLAVNKYGIDKFVISIIEEFNFYTKDDILSKEQYYLDSLKPQYNICKTAGTQLGAKRSAEFKAKSSERMKGKAAWNKGLKMGSQSEQAIKNRSASLTGRKLSKETRDKISGSLKGKQFTKEHKEKLSKAKIKHGKYIGK